MSYRDPSYVIFDGDKDRWAYQYMRGWQLNERIPFDFRDAHDLDNMTSRAQDEHYVKANLRGRMEQSTAVILLVGESTQYLYKFVRWELELAQNLDLPIIAANLNGLRMMDADRCPALIRSSCVMHVAFKMKIIQFALDEFVKWYRFTATPADKAAGWRYYPDSAYAQLGIKD